MCRFVEGLKVASLKSYISLGGIPAPEKRLLCISKRARTRWRKKVTWKEIYISNPSTVQIDRFPQVKYTCVDLGEGET